MPQFCDTAYIYWNYEMSQCFLVDPTSMSIRSSDRRAPSAWVRIRSWDRSGPSGSVALVPWWDLSGLLVWADASAYLIAARPQWLSASR